MPGPAAPPPVTHKREFWVLTGYAVALGMPGAFTHARVRSKTALSPAAGSRRLVQDI